MNSIPKVTGIVNNVLNQIFKNRINAGRNEELKIIGSIKKSGFEWEKIEVTLKSKKGYKFIEVKVYKLDSKGKWGNTKEMLTIPSRDIGEFKGLIEEAEKTIEEGFNLK